MGGWIPKEWTFIFLSIYCEEKTDPDEGSVRVLFSPYILQIEAQMFSDSGQHVSEVLWRAIGDGNEGLAHLSAEKETKTIKLNSQLDLVGGKNLKGIWTILWCKLLLNYPDITVYSTVLPPLFKQASVPEFSRRSRLGQTGELVTQESDGFRKFKKTCIVESGEEETKRSL